MKIKSKHLPIIGVIAVIAVVLFSRTKTFQNTTENSSGDGSNQVSLVDTTEFSKLVNQSGTFLLDVHTPEQTHIPGTDAFIPYNVISENTDKLPEDKSTPILVYCRSGSMSAEAAREIAELGYTNVYDLEGGINAYREHNNEVVVTPSTKDLGTVLYGDVETTSFTLTNFTPLPMKVTRVSTSCGCTSAEVEDEELDAYDTTQVNVSFDPAVHKDDTDLGDIVRTIYIETDNPNFERVTAEITAIVVKR